MVAFQFFNITTPKTTFVIPNRIKVFFAAIIEIAKLKITGKATKYHISIIQTYFNHSSLFLVFVTHLIVYIDCGNLTFEYSELPSSTHDFPVIITSNCE